MVWGVCRRLLNHHDAEDAFQAAFLVLVRKAADVPRQAVANWLYGVARQTAVRLRAMAAKRRRRETQVVNMPEPTLSTVRDADLQRVVDEELSRLPDHYRGVVVLCDLEGMTRKAAARQLGIPEGSVASRLARARVMLAKRLAQRAIVFSGGALAVGLSAASASASAPPSLVAFTVKAASLLAAGQTAGVVSAKVAALTEGVVQAMFVTKIKSVSAVVLVVVLALGGIGLGVGLPTNPVAVAQQPDDAKRTDDKAALELSKAVYGLQPKQGDKEKEDPNADEKKLLPGEIKRELNRGVVLRVKLVELDAKKWLMTADVEPTKDVINPKNPLRMTNLPLAGNVPVFDGTKELKLTDLKAGNILRLQLESWKTDGEAMAVTYIRVEDGTEKKEKSKTDGTDEKGKSKTDGKAGPAGQKVLTPEEAIKQMPTENVTVQFKVASVQAMPNPLTGFGGPDYYIFLHDGGRFTARMARSADQFMADQFMKLGVKPGIVISEEKAEEVRKLPLKHFGGKVVRFIGRVEPDSGNSFQMWVHDITLIGVVKE
jgi:RNA polymerase sigma factor (sigma-70 family)